MVGTSVASAPIILTKLSYGSHFEAEPPSTLTAADLEYQLTVEVASVE
ncbi:MAG: hypothetical protein QF535_22275 [Anaerolineales bacterium]|nr:hypothetical protein [Anaerolineales bacterium]